MWLFTDTVSVIYSVITVTNCGLKTKIIFPACVTLIFHNYVFRVNVKSTQPTQLPIP